MFCLVREALCWHWAGQGARPREPAGEPPRRHQARRDTPASGTWRAEPGEPPPASHAWRVKTGEPPPASRAGRAKPTGPSLENRTLGPKPGEPPPARHDRRAKPGEPCPGSQAWRAMSKPRNRAWRARRGEHKGTEPKERSLGKQVWRTKLREPGPGKPCLARLAQRAKSGGPCPGRQAHLQSFFLQRQGPSPLPVLGHRCS